MQIQIGRRIPQMEPSLGEEEKTALVEVINSGWFVESKRTREFERVFADYVGSSYACAVSSGMAALHVALKALGVGPGDEVIVPDLTFVATANAVELCGATPVFVDIERKSLCLDLTATREALTPKTKAIMVVDFNGRCPDLIAFEELASSCGIYLVEDACHTLGSYYRGKHMGTMSKVGIFSFSTPKVITTGQGGMITTEDPGLHNICLLLKDFGRDAQKKHDMAGAFEHAMVGYNYKFTEFQAAVGLAQMKKLAERIKRKRAIYRLINAALADLDQIEFIPLADDQVPWFNDLLLQNSEIRQALTLHLRDLGIETRFIYPPLHRLPFYLGPRADRRFAVTDEMAERGLWLPSSSLLSDEDVLFVCDSIRGFFNKFS